MKSSLLIVHVYCLDLFTKEKEITRYYKESQGKSSVTKGANNQLQAITSLVAGICGNKF